MKLEEAKRKVQITDKERNSVNAYLRYSHTAMNSLASFDIENYISSAKKGWLLPGAEGTYKWSKENTSDEKGEEVLSNIEDIANIYSAMCKYEKYEKKADLPRKIYRGTSKKEAESLRTGGTYDRIISTSISEDVAKSFTEYDNPAILEIHVEQGIPFLDVNDFLDVNRFLDAKEFSDEDYIHSKESEILFPPFSQIKESKKGISIGVWNYYDVSLDAPSLRPFKEGEKDKFRDIIKRDFATIIDKGKEYVKCLESINWLEQIFQKTNSLSNPVESNQKKYRDEILEEKRRIRKDIEDYRNKAEILKPELDEFSNIIKSYIQGICFEKQKEFEEASKIVAQEEQRLALENTKRIQEEQKQLGIKKYETECSVVLQKLTSVPTNIDNSYNYLRNRASKYENLSQYLGIEYSSSLDPDSSNKVENYNRLIASNIFNIKDRLSAININSKTSLEDANLANGYLGYYDRIANSALSAISELERAISMFDEQSLFEIKYGIDCKAQEIIRNTKIKVLEQKKESIENRKVSLIDRMFRGQKLKDAELKNIGLQIQYEKSRHVVEKEKYSIRDTMSDLLAFTISELGGQATPEIQEFSKKIQSCFRYNQTEVEEMANYKVQSKPLPLQSSKKESKKDKIRRLSEENRQLSIDIGNNKNSNSNIYFQNQYAVKSSNGIIEFMNALGKIASITGQPDTRSNVRSTKNGYSTRSNPISLDYL